MNPNRIQFYLLLGVGAIALHFSILFGREWIGYLSLNSTAQAHITQWEIIPLKKRFAIKAEYTFLAQEKTMSGSFILSPPYYLNEVAALNELKIKAKKPWTVYYPSKYPQHSVLEKCFPFGLFFRMSCSFGILIYFFTLRKKIRILKIS